MLVVGDNITQTVVCNDSTTQQEQVQYSQKYLFATITAEKEDKIYPITVKEVDEGKRAHRHFSNCFKTL